MNAWRTLVHAAACLAVVTPVYGLAPDRDVTAVERLTAWPKPEDKDALLVDIERLCKSRTPEMGVQAREALQACGASAVPFLLERYGKERDEGAQKRLREMLVELTAAEHTRLLAKDFESKHAQVRTFALWRAAAFPDPQLQPAAVAALARAQKPGAKIDPEELYAAALCATSAGSIQGLTVLHDAATTKWDRRGPEIRTALEASRGSEAAAVVIPWLKSDDRKRTVAALNLLAGCGDKAAVTAVRPFLDDSDFSVCTAAINALRGIVDGDPPLQQLPVFEAIETAKKWKAKT
jgi:hypothetical protein